MSMPPQLHKWLFLSVFIVAACSPKTLVVRQMTDLMDTGITAFERDGDLDLMEKAIPAHIKLLEAMLANDPDDRRMLTLLSRLYGSYAFGFIETRLEEALYLDHASDDRSQASASLKDQVNRYYAKGMDYALMALEKGAPRATKAFQKVNTIASYLDKLGQQEVAALFWYGFNLGALVNHNLDSVRAVSRAHVAQQVMERVIELDPAYNHAGAHLFLMSYFGSRPSMMGGSQARARDHYDQLKQIAGDQYLLADLFYARFCLQQQQDREGFIAAMRRIEDNRTDRSDVALYNAIASRRAAIYLSAVDSFFD